MQCEFLTIQKSVLAILKVEMQKKKQIGSYFLLLFIVTHFVNQGFMLQKIYKYQGPINFYQGDPFFKFICYLIVIM